MEVPRGIRSPRLDRLTLGTVSRERQMYPRRVCPDRVEGVSAVPSVHPVNFADGRES